MIRQLLQDPSAPMTVGSMQRVLDHYHQGERGYYQNSTTHVTTSTTTISSGDETSPEFWSQVQAQQLEQLQRQVPALAKSLEEEQKEKEDLEGENERLNHHVQSLSEQVETLHREVESLKDQVESTDDREGVNQQLATEQILRQEAERKLLALQDRERMLVTELAQSRASLESSREEISKETERRIGDLNHQLADQQNAIRTLEETVASGKRARSDLEVKLEEARQATSDGEEVKQLRRQNEELVKQKNILSTQIEIQQVEVQIAQQELKKVKGNNDWKRKHDELQKLVADEKQASMSRQKRISQLEHDLSVALAAPSSQSSGIKMQLRAAEARCEDAEAELEEKASELAKLQVVVKRLEGELNSRSGDSSEAQIAGAQTEEEPAKMTRLEMLRNKRNEQESQMRSRFGELSRSVPKYAVGRSSSTTADCAPELTTQEVLKQLEVELDTARQELSNERLRAAQLDIDRVAQLEAQQREMDELVDAVASKQREVNQLKEVARQKGPSLDEHQFAALVELVGEISGRLDVVLADMPKILEEEASLQELLSLRRRDSSSKQMSVDYIVQSVNAAKICTDALEGTLATKQAEMKSLQVQAQAYADTDIQQQEKDDLMVQLRNVNERKDMLESQIRSSEEEIASLRRLIEFKSEKRETLGPQIEQIHVLIDARRRELEALESRVASTLSPEDLRAEAEKLGKEVEKVSKRKSSLLSELDKSEAEIAELRQRISEGNADKEALDEELESLRDSLVTTNRDVDDLEERLATTEAELNLLKNQMVEGDNEKLKHEIEHLSAELVVATARQQELLAVEQETGAELRELRSCHSKRSLTLNDDSLDAKASILRKKLDNAKALISSLEQNQATALSEISALEAEVTNLSVVDLDDEIATLSTQLTDATKLIESLVSEHGSSEKHIEELRVTLQEKKASTLMQQAKIKALKSKLEGARNLELSLSQSLVPLKKEVESLHSEMSELEDEYLVERDELSKLEEKRDDMVLEMKSIEESLRSYEEDKKTFYTNRKRLKRELEDVGPRIQALLVENDSSMKELEAVRELKKSKDRKVKAMHADREAIDIKLEEANSHVTSLEDSLAKAQGDLLKEKKALKDLEVENESLRPEVKRLRADLAQACSQIEQLVQDGDGVREELSSVRKVIHQRSLGSKPIQFEIRDLRAETQEVFDLLSQTAAFMVPSRDDSLKTSADINRRLERDLAEANKRIESLERLLNRSERTIENQEDKIFDLEEQLSRGDVESDSSASISSKSDMSSGSESSDSSTSRTSNVSGNAMVKLHQRLDKLELENRKLSTQNATLEAQVEDTDALKVSISTLKSSNIQLRDELEEAKRECLSLQYDIDNLRSNLDHSERELSDHPGSDQMDELMTQLEQKEREILSLRRDLAFQHSDIDSVGDTIETSPEVLRNLRNKENECQSLHTELDRLRQDIERRDTDINELNIEIKLKQEVILELMSHQAEDSSDSDSDDGLPNVKRDYEQTLRKASRMSVQLAEAREEMMNMLDRLNEIEGKAGNGATNEDQAHHDCTEDKSGARFGFLKRLSLTG